MKFTPGLLKTIDSFFNTGYTYFLLWTKMRKGEWTKEIWRRHFRMDFFSLLANISCSFALPPWPCANHGDCLDQIRFAVVLFQLSLYIQHPHRRVWNKLLLREGTSEDKENRPRFPAKRKLRNPERIKQSSGICGLLMEEHGSLLIGWLSTWVIPQEWCMNCFVPLCLSWLFSKDQRKAHCLMSYLNFIQRRKLHKLNQTPSFSSTCVHNL